MRYFVIADDGNRYGPVDIQTLNQWIQEGRILPSTLIEEEGSGARIAASSVSGLTFGQAPPTANYSTPNREGPFWRQPGPAVAYAQGNTEVTIAWVLAVVAGIFCCCSGLGFAFSAVGIAFAALALKKGNRRAQAPLMVNIFVTVSSLAFFIIAWPMLRQSFTRAEQMVQDQQKLQQQGQKAPDNPLGL
jgi:hypothetical protein